MRLKKLVLVGFKSFADKTTLHFDDGITCIVGPNGCGKSNIADAFRWVLGEQSAKSLRGNKMPDVIFAGTSQRKPVNLAEVSLTLTDIKGALPVDYEEVTLTRRLHRSGESEYLLNGNVVRLKDLQNLFLDSGIGRNAFSIFEQGKIDQVISYTPLERRHIFEEAAGILRFLQRKREALKRLEQADQNLSRVKDIYQEVENQITVLKEQAEKAKRFKENKELLETLEKASYVLRWDQLEKKWTDAEKRKLKHQVQLKEFLETLKSSQSQNQQVKGLLQQEEKNLKAKSEELFKIRSEKEIHTREHQSNQQRIQEALQKEKKLKRELEELKLSQGTRQKALVDIQQKHGRMEAEFKEAEAKLTSQTDKVKLKEKELTQLRNELQSKQQQHLKFLQEENRLSSEYKHNEARLENSLDRKKILEERKQKLLEDYKQIQLLAQEKKQQLTQVTGLVDSHKERLEQYEDDIKTVSKEIEASQKEIENSQKKILELKARQTVLLRLREDLEGFSSGSKKLLQESNDPNSSLYNKIRPLYELLNPHPEVVDALAAVLHHYTQTLVVEKQADLLTILEFTQKHRIQDYSLICVELVSKLPSVSNPHSFVKKVESNVIVNHLLRHLQEGGKKEEAIQLLQQSVGGQLWLQEGLFIDHNAVFFSVKANENQVFLRESELRNLEEELLKKEDQAQVLNKQFNLLQQSKSKLQLERSELDKMLRRDEMKLVEVNFGYQRCLGDQEKMKAEITQNEKETVAISEHIEQQQTLVKQLQDTCFSIKQEVTKLQGETGFLEKEVEKQFGALRVQQQDQKEKGETYQQLVEDKQKLLHQMNVLEVQEKEYHKQEQHFLDELSEIEDFQAKVGKQVPQFHHSIEQIEARLIQTTELCHELEKKIEAHKNSLEKIEIEASSVHDLCRKSENEINQLNLQEAQYRSTAQSLEQELQERYQLELQVAKQQMAVDKSLEQTEKQIRSLRQAVQNAGQINLASIEDLEKHQLRYGFLSKQLEDMSVSKNELVEIISQVDGESRKLFRETFDVIRENFKRNFGILFNGGEADLQFTEAEDILEAGIEIIAKPPGKQMRSISLLSGGEKCLTAVALLFSIFEVKQAPFCILDEIDAPLDDTNVERFTNVVKHFVDRCQFLIITHNKRTMAIGNMIFGVSMEEKGVSKLLSLEFAREEAPEANLVS